MKMAWRRMVEYRGGSRLLFAARALYRGACAHPLRIIFSSAAAAASANSRALLSLSACAALPLHAGGTHLLFTLPLRASLSRHVTCLSSSSLALAAP